MSDRARKLTTHEISVLLHLLRCGDGRSPVTLLKGGRELATRLWRAGLIDVWHRQSLTSGRLEGPFYTLTWNGRERATQLFLARQSRAALATEPKCVASRSVIPTQPRRSPMFRQGDVLIIPVGELPTGLLPVSREKGRLVLAHGEATGHAHAIKNQRAALFSDPKLAAVFMHVSGNAPVELEHDEHDTIRIPPGNYQVVRQREYSPEEIRNVAD